MANDKQRGELDSMTKDELLDYAEERDINVHQNWLKEDIIQAIVKRQKAAAKPETKPDSLKHHEDRKAKIQAETSAEAENQEIANFRGLPQHGETREQLLARIRKMRDEKPEPTVHETFRSEGLQKEFEAEQKAGQEAVAKAQAERDRMQTLSTEYEKGEKNKVR